MRGATVLLILSSGLIRAADADLLQQANASYRAMRPAEAARLYRQYLASHPDRPDVRTYLGASLLNLGQTDEAAREASRAIALDDRYARAWTLLGRIQSGQRRCTSARASFLKAIELDPGDRDTWYFFGRSSYQASQFQEAVDAFRNVLRLGARQSRIYENLGLAYEALNRPEDAEAAYRSALDQPDRSYAGLVDYGAFLFRQGRSEESLRLLREAFRLAPDGDNVRFELARVLFHAGELTEAASVLEGARAGTECRAHNLLTRIYSMQGKTAEAGREAGLLAGCAQP